MCFPDVHEADKLTPASRGSPSDQTVMLCGKLDVIGRFIWAIMQLRLVAVTRQVPPVCDASNFGAAVPLVVGKDP